MTPLPPLAHLGPRICIMGPSNSGKSTLAVAIAEKQSLPVIHLDQLYHQPNTDWQPREHAVFLQLHREAISAERWVIEGNYTRCLPERIARATGYILLDLAMPVSLLRYIRRCCATTPRAGALQGSTDHINLAMLRHITWVTPGNRRRYHLLYQGLSLPRCRLVGAKAINRAWQEWCLTPRPATGILPGKTGR
ncbi:MAG: hypothetical protein LZT29_01355 [Pantoea stewartii]|uniref:AAA family ATPase n=1 Tax=Pantoea stewartii TaxID=66269 RepID=UPI0013DE5FF3|nr:AAA family ATPase [Pantoea stewartii]QIE98221.1 AAA family ATPase [Pantoea stewartii]WHS98435.1 MAG: hypothetical protein LZT29_01355 [Pantoea stewartii]